MPSPLKYREHRLNFKEQEASAQATSPATSQEAAPKYKLLSWLWKSFKGLCFSLGFFSLISFVLWGFVLSSLSEKASAPPVLPSKMVLYLPLEGAIGELEPKVNMFAPFEPAAPTLRTIVTSIDYAAKDDRVQELYVRLNNPNISLGQIQEIRAAIKRFKDAGKRTRIYASSFGEGAGGLRNLYFASIFDERWMQPLGLVTMTGLRVEMPFFKGVLDKVGITPDFYQREEYKTAYESFTHEAMTKPNRQSMNTVVEALKAAILADVPADLGMKQAAFEKLMDQGLFTAEEALSLGLITQMSYPDILVETLQEAYLGDPKSDKPLFIPLSSYAPDAARHFAGKGKGKVALIYANGAIVSSNDSNRDGIAAADEIAPALLAAADDASIKAVVLRINSPGGSPIASESILRAVEKVQESGKKVVVSMGDVAASGGYWIATKADRIFALPVTLTGSIGVVGGKFAAGDLWDKVGVNWDRSIQWGQNAGMWSVNEPFSKSQQVQINKMLDRVYSAFLERVADGRGMSLEQADEIARGRVWPGSYALGKQLVDELGDLHDAMDYTARDLGYDSADDLRIVVLPKPLSPLEEILQIFEQRGLVMQGLRFQGQLQGSLGRFIQETGLGTQMDMMQAAGDDGVLLYEPIAVR